MKHLLYISLAALTMGACGDNDRPLFDDASTSTSTASTSSAGGGGASSASTGASGTTTSTGGPLACIPGQQIACPCPGGGEGAQACHEDGSGFGPCLGCGGAAGGAGGSEQTTGGGGKGDGSGGAGGCEPDPNPCTIARNCGTIERGCGVVAECPSCESTSEYLSCNPRTHRCACTLADDNPEAVAKCITFPDAKPYYCGEVRPFFRGPIDCVANDTSPISNGEIVVCCYEE